VAELDQEPASDVEGLNLWIDHNIRIATATPPEADLVFLPTDAVVTRER